MEEIKVDEYIKTVSGHIGKIINYDDGMYTAKMRNITIDLYIDGIKNHSKNIIDLIEAGDYLDGVRVDSVEKDENGHVFYAQNYDLPAFDLKNIKSICTRERFENAEYKLDN